MKKIVLAVLVIGLVIVGLMLLNPVRQNSNMPVPDLQEAKKNQPSDTLLDYTDPAGFSFSYPDNLSIVKNDLEGGSVYADIQLASKDLNGSLNLKISDSQFATLDDWLKLNKAAYKEPPKEVKLGSLKALEIKTADRLYLGALDQGVFFTIEIPLVEEDFWMKVYDKVLISFSFVSPEPASSDVTFEGEEVVD